MSEADDLRAPIDELVADLNALVAKLDALDMKLGNKVGSSFIEATFDAHEELAAARYRELLARLETVGARISTYNAQYTAHYDSILESLDIEKRLQALEREG